MISVRVEYTSQMTKPSDGLELREYRVREALPMCRQQIIVF